MLLASGTVLAEFFLYFLRICECDLFYFQLSRVCVCVICDVAARRQRVALCRRETSAR